MFYWLLRYLHHVLIIHRAYVQAFHSVSVLINLDFEFYLQLSIGLEVTGATDWEWEMTLALWG